MDPYKDNKPLNAGTPKGNLSNNSSLQKYLGLGFSLLALILLPTLLGNWLDNSLKHSIPWLTLILSLLGILLAFFYVFKELRD